MVVLKHKSGGVKRLGNMMGMEEEEEERRGRSDVEMHRQ